MCGAHHLCGFFFKCKEPIWQSYILFSIKMGLGGTLWSGKIGKNIDDYFFYLKYVLIA